MSDLTPNIPEGPVPVRDESMTEILAATTALFPPDEHNRRAALVSAAAGVAVTTGMGVLAYKNGLSVDTFSHVLDAEIIPRPPVYSSIVKGMIVANEGMRQYAPVVALGALGIGAKRFLKRDPVSRREAQMAKIEFSATDQLTDNTDLPRNVWRKCGNQARKVVKSVGVVGVAAAAVLFTGAPSSLEHEVAHGPLRPVERSFDMAVGPHDTRAIIVQDKKMTYMGDSYVSTKALDAIAEDASFQDITITPIKKTLPNIQGVPSLVLSIPDETFNKLSGYEPVANCKDILPPIIIDGANPAHVGDVVEVNSAKAVVVSKVNNITQMNRDIGVMAAGNYADCVEEGGEDISFGAIIGSDNPDALKIVADSMRKHGLEGKDFIVSENDFKNNNVNFWQQNGTSLILQLIACAGTFGYFALGKERKSIMQRNIKEIGTLHAIGVDWKQIRRIETLRAVRDTGLATVVALPFFPVMAGVYNAATRGLAVGESPRDVAVGFSIALAAKLAGSRRSVRLFKKHLNVDEAVR